MKRSSLRASLGLVGLGLISCISLGCGSKAPTAQTSSPNANASSSARSSEGPQATEIVSQFLDRVRRGGTESGAESLLTELAQAQLKRLGRTIEPIGSPDASFTVTRGEVVPDDPNSMLVHSLWREPDGQGANAEYQVVWALQREAVGWRISGLAMEVEAGQEPLVLNFEDESSVQAVLGVSDPGIPTDDNSSQAQAGTGATLR